MDHEFLTTGLTSAQVKEMTDSGRINSSCDTPTKSIRQILYTNIFTFFNLVNVILAALVVSVGSYKNCLFIGVIFFNTVIGIIQEIRAKRTVDKLSLISAPKVAVLRDGEEKEINTCEIVMGDLMLLGAGRQICSDCTVMQGECEVNESLITGESDPVMKKQGDTMLSGSFVVSGNVKAQVTSVGPDNFASKITAGAKYLKKNNSVMLRSLDVIIKGVAVCIVPIAIGLFINSMLISSGQTVDRAVVSTVAALVGMIPEGLYLLASVVIAVSVIRLAKHKTLVQEMYCIETLARVDTLCLDKTGTITEGIMQVEGTELLQPDFPLDEAMAAFVSVMADDNPTFNAVKAYWGAEEAAAPAADKQNGLPQAEAIFPFSSAKKWSGAQFSEGSFIFGAPEFILGDGYGQIRERCEKAQGEGLRVLAAAYSAEKFQQRELPDNITVAALIFIGDVIRREAPETLSFFEKQGVDIKIISGDNPVTVSKIACRAGVKNAEAAIDASALSLEDIPEAAGKYTVFGRVSPDQKLALVKALKSQGHTVGMTGDGVNDVLALKEADCSIAMQSGSDAARRVSNLVLLDSNFASMPKIVAEGRRSVNNLQRSGALFLTKTIYSFLLALIFVFLPLPYPFQPIQLTMISATAIGIPSFLLALEPNTEIIKGGFIRNILRHSLPQGLALVFGVAASVSAAAFTSVPTDGMATMTTYVAAAVSYFAVFRTMKPVKLWKLAMLAVLIIGFAAAARYFKELFSLMPLDIYSWIAAGCIFAVSAGIMLLLEKAADPMMSFFSGVFAKVRGFVHNQSRR